MRCDLQSCLRRRLEVQTNCCSYIYVLAICKNHEVSMCGWQRLRYKKVFLMHPQLPYVTIFLVTFCLPSLLRSSAVDERAVDERGHLVILWKSSMWLIQLYCISLDYTVRCSNSSSSNTTMACMCTHTVHRYVCAWVVIVCIMVATMQNVVCCKMFVNRKFCKLLAKWVGRIFCK